MTMEQIEKFRFIYDVKDEFHFNIKYVCVDGVTEVIVVYQRKF